MIKRKGLLLAALTALLVSVVVLGQTTTATLSGVVKDASGALVPDVKVTARNAATGATRDTRTDNEGRYSLTNLGPGQYEVRAERTGFKTAAQSGVILTVGGATALDMTVQIGEVTEVVEVKQEEPLIEPTKAELSRVVNERTIESLPIIGRNFVDFAKLSSGVAPGRENTGGGAFKEPDTGVGSAAAPRLTFGGQSELSTLILVDGADNIQNATGLPRVTPSQEAVREFRVLNSTFLAEYGRALGGFVNIVTKSGTNRYNGSAYYFGMNDELNAQPLLTGDNPALRQNQYGATIGGPLRKDRTFFFGSYEGQRRAESNKFSSVIFNNLDAINVTKRFFGLTPETTDVLRANDYDGFLAKLDHKITNNNDFSVRYNLLDSTTENFLGGGGRASAASTTRRNNDVLDQSLVASDTALLASNVVNEARVQWARRTFDFTPVINEPDLEVSNLLITGKTTSDMDFYRESRLQLSDNLSVVSGGHALKFGADFNNIRNTSRLDLFFPARVIFASLGGPGVAGPTFLNQTPVVFWWGLANGSTTRGAVPVNPFTQAVPSDIASLTTTRVDHNSYGFFGQDEWKATSNLTITYGLRYDFETYPDLLVTRRDKNNFQPRVGLAYSFTPRTVVRAGFGIFNDRQFTSIGQQISVVQLGSAGDLPNANVVFPGVSPIRGLFIQPTVGGPVAPTTTTCRIGGPTITTTSAAQLATCIFTTTGVVPAAPMVGGLINPGFRDNKGGFLRTPYSEQASLEISHELGGGVAITVGYLYVHGLKLAAHTGLLNGVQTGTLINGVVVPGVVAGGKPVFNRALGGRVFPELGDFYVTDDIGYSIHHGGTFEVEKRFSRGFSFHGSYSFSKTINNAESVANLADLPEGPNIGTERAVSRQTVPHRFTLAFVSQIPESAGFLGKFKFSSLLSVQSGRRFNIFAGSDANGDGNPLSDRPSNLGRNTLEGPGFASFDMRVAREFRLNERVTAEFSGDFFNLFNRTNITDLNTVFGATTITAQPNPVLGFNTPRDASNPFQFQYGMKLRF
ncbi:MAG TPA: TonB-dependent receptor [Blastocatellia bacterium]|nr:TonB-dependent receptor [Blastocatellia bacterium]